MAALTFNGSGGVNFGGLAANYLTSPAIAIAGGLSTNGTNSITINITGNLIGTPSGTYQLIGYSTIGGTGTDAFRLAPLANRGNGTLSFSAGLVNLNFNGVDYLRWSGSFSTAWNTTTPNWNLNSTGGTTTFIDSPGDTVVFDDAGTNGTVNIASAVHPSGVTFNNSARNYTLQGAAGIAGPASLTMNGPGTLTINNSNSYTGGTTISGGLLNVNNSSALGSGTFTIAGGTLDSTSGGVTLASGAQNWNADFSFNGSNSLNLGSGSVTLGAPVQVTVANNTLTVGGGISGGYGLTLAGSGTLLLTGANTYNGGTTIGSGTLQIGTGGSLSPSGSVTLGGGAGSGVLALGNGAAAVNQTISGLTISGIGAANSVNSGSIAASTLTIGPGGIVANASGAINAPLAFGAGQAWTTDPAQTLAVNGNVSTGGNAALTIAGGGTAIVTGAISGGGGLTVSNGTLSISGSSSAFGTLLIGNVGSSTNTPTLNISGGAASFTGGIGFGSAAGARGVLNVSNTATVTVTGGNIIFGGNSGPASNNTASGLINQSGGTFNANITSQVLMPWSNGGYGAYVLSGGTLNVPTAPFVLANFSTNMGLFSQSNGVAAFSNLFQINNGSTRTGVADVSGGILTHKTTGNFMAVGVRGLGVLNVRGSGYVQEQTGNFFVTAAASAKGIVNVLSGGTLEVNKIQKNTGTATVNFAWRYAPGLFDQRRRRFLRWLEQRLGLPRRLDGRYQ